MRRQFPVVYHSDSDRIKDECGVFGVYGDDHASELVYLGLFALQHRGEESAGIAVSDGNHISLHKDMGLVEEVFNEDILQYSTTCGELFTGASRYCP